ncbi:MAG TPA: hypothetical protein VKR83_11285 [Ktedonobacteraceae bacterium]|nr:hypothetical protein [Ktedonobacteraceae bacterium]
MTNNTAIPSYDELSSFIIHKFALLRAPYMDWANLARQAVQGLAYDRQKLADLELIINERRAELRTAVIIASEHFDEEQLVRLRDQASMSKFAWKSLKKNCPITIKNGFTLVSY